MSEPGKRGITRRQLVAGGAAGTAVVAGAGYGRFAIGDEFEEHAAAVLGTSTAAATQLTRAARRRLGDGEYEQVAAAFLAVTTFPGNQVAPRLLREKAVRKLVSSMIAESYENLMYLGLREPTDSAACTGLLQV